MRLKFKSICARFAVLLFAGGLLIYSPVTAAEDYISEDDLYGEELESGLEVSDPLERLNRAIFGFNDFVYMELLDPVANTYTTIMPDPVEEGVTNFFDNLEYPVRLAGNLLQGRFEGAWVETKRFAVNTTVGLGGIRRPADSIEGMAAIPYEDVGQAFGAWGIGGGPYLVLPLLGPSNLRDLAGLIGDRAVHPLKEPFSVIDDWDWEWRTALWATDLVNSSPRLVEIYKRMKGGAIDPYGSVKNAYTQRRREAIKQ